MSSRAIEAARAFVRIYADDSALRKTLGGIDGQLKMAAARYSGIGAGAGVAAAGMAALGLGVVAVSANAEMASVSMEVMLGSAARASAMISQINSMAVESPFGSAEFTQAAQVLLNFGVAADSVLPTISMLGDVAAGDAEKLSRLTLAFGQMSSAGRLMGQDLMQMINAGFSPLEEISKTTGESMLALRKRMEAGGISSAEVANAFKAATSEGGRFAGMTQRISKTTIGTWMTIKDEVMLLAKGIGDELLPSVNIVLNVVRSVVGIFKGWGKVIALTGVAALGFATALTAVVAGLTAYTKAVAIAAAFSGPKGLAMLFAGAAGAGLALGFIDMATKDLTVSTTKTHTQLETMAGKFDAVSTTADVATDAMKKFSEANDVVRDSLDSMKSSATKVSDEVQRFQDALAMSGQAGMVLTTGNPLVEAFTAEKSGYVAMLEDINREIAVLSGNATEAGLRIADMMAAGVDPARIKALQDAVAKRDELAQAKENKEYWKNRQEELQAAADQVKASIRTVEDRFAMERQRHQQLVDAGMISQTDADKSLAKIRDTLSNSGRSIGGMQAQDIRSLSGASQLTTLINRTGDVPRQQLEALQRIARNTEGGFSPEVVHL